MHRGAIREYCYKQHWRHSYESLTSTRLDLKNRINEGFKNRIKSFSTKLEANRLISVQFVPSCKLALISPEARFSKVSKRFVGSTSEGAYYRNRETVSKRAVAAHVD